MSEQQRQTMIVTGTGNVTGEPDLVTIQLGITTHSEQLADAQAENTKRSQSVIDRLTTLGIPNNEIQTSSYTVSPQYDYIEGQQLFRNYEVQHQLRVTARDIPSIGEIIDGAVQSGATDVSSIQFSIENSSGLYEQALSKAVGNAQAHAQALAQAADVVLNHVPVNIQEAVQSEARPFTVQMAKMSAAPRIEPGTLDIQATVTVTYSFR
ncbi:SIMPL domain-containing protein [Sporosarcina aquimarina]|uniref:SIMPL domain-containing protein n=1 Tax=Sporosarcina aquimarina TaxID=114975 RepID=UPI00203ACB3A|nr:SIMPL domain-containing protein [Sporosarcina aquimarina]MCM3757621.1 SIMPL domain-containing protein [Sporosarcina aquimarina]